MTLHLKKRKRYQTQTMEPFKYSDTHAFYNKYYTMQSGSILHVHRGRTVAPKRGEGIASMLANIVNKALPYAETVGERLLPEAGNSREICCLENRGVSQLIFR